MSGPELTRELLLGQLLEAYRGREVRVHELRGSLTCSQAAMVPADAWLDDSRAQIETLSNKDVPQLLSAAQESDLLDVLKALQIAWPSKTTAGSARWVALAKVLIADPGATAGRKGRQLLEFVVNQVDQLDESACVALVEALTDWAQSPHENFSKCLELLPKLLFKVAKMEQVDVQRRAMDTRYTGAEYRAAVIDTICRQKWPATVALAMITTLRELELSEEQMERALAHIKKQTSSTDLQQLPPLVYQLLLFSTQGCRTKILEYLLGTFNALDSACSAGSASQKEGDHQEELVHVEGTVIMHFTYAIRQDLALGQDFIRLCKTKAAGLTTFEVALLLSVSRLQRFSAKAADILRRGAELQAQHAFKQRSSPWIQGLRQLPRAAPVDELLRTVLRRGVGGWDAITPAVVQHAVAMLEANSKKFSGDAGGGRPVGSYVAACKDGAMTKAVARQMVQSSVELLELAFKIHKSVRDEILAQIFNRVLTREDCVPHLVALLARIVRRCSTDVLDSLPKIKEALEYLGFMSSATAVSLIAALEPVLVLHPSLQDYLVIVLRKSIFSREPEARMVALNGFLFLAEQSSSSSRGGGSSSTGGAGRAGVAPDPLGLEIIGQLRRCMVQQVEMRERLYDGLCQVAASKPKLIDSIISALLPNLQRCWDDGRSQLSVDKCIDDKGNITEPIPKLLRAVARCVYLAGGSSSSKSRAAGDVHPELVTRSRSILDKCVEWILTCAVEDFELDKETDFQGDDGVKFSSLAKLAIGLHEVLLEYLVLCTDLNPGTVRNKVFVIANKLEEITALVRVNTKGAGLGGVKGCGKNRKTSPEETLLTLDVSLKVLAMGGCDGKVEGVDSDVCTTIFAKSSLIGQILTTVNHQIEQLRDAPGTCFDAEFPKLKQMGALLIRQYLSECHEDRSFSFTVAAAGGKKGSDKSKTVVKKLSLLALKALETCMLTVCTNLGKEKVSELAEAVAAEMTDQSVVELPEEMDAAERHVAKCALNFQALLKDVLPQVDQSDAPLLSAPMLIINIGTALRDSLSLDSQGVLLGWTKDICTDQPNVVESPVFVKALVQSYLHLAVADEGVAMLATAITLAEDVCVVLPQNSDEASQAEMQIAAHGIVSEDSVGGVMSPVADLVKATCEEVEWCCAYLDQLTASTSWIGDDSDHPQRVSAIKDINSVEDAALKRVRAVVDVMIPLSKVTSQDNGEPVLEALTRVYRSADFLAGRVLASKNLRKLFTSLMHRIGDDLNPVMYLAITSFADCDDEIKKGNRSKVVKESRLIPTLIFYVEKVEACLLKIQKIPNSVDFMRHFKRSTARDFNVKNFDKISEDAVKEGGAKKKGKGKGKRDKDDADENLSSAQPSAKKPKRA